MGLKEALSSIHPLNRDPGITLGQAALISGLGLLIMGLAAPFAEFFVYPKVVIPGNIEAAQGLDFGEIFYRRVVETAPVVLKDD
jgi:hypothetical protein